MSDFANDSGLVSKSSFETPAQFADEKPLPDNKSSQGDPAFLEDKDVEAAGENKIDEDDAGKPNPRPGLSTWRWIISLIALFLGAMLYGMP
jgi:hypothetical protein